MVRNKAEEIRIGGLTIRFLVEGATSGGSIAMFEFDVAVGAKMPAAHSHDGYEETLYGLAGVLTMTVDGRQSEIGAGDVLSIRRGAVIASTTFIPTRFGFWQSSRRAFWARSISAKSQTLCRRQPAGRPILQPSRQ